VGGNTCNIVKLNASVEESMFRCVFYLNVCMFVVLH
jgi:hypothetical protein